MNAIVEAENLSRFYGIVLGLNNVSFRIQPGITGVIGPNGAGKTTLFRLVTGQINASSGSLRVFGEDPWNSPSVQARLAYCPESETLPAGLRPMDWLVSLGMISGLSSRDAKTRAAAMLDRVKLAPEHRKKQLSMLSKGMKQRVKLAQCLLHEPALIILDEPMNGLDPMGREEFGNVLRELAKDGASVVISSHILHDLEALCANFLLLRWGRMPRRNEETAPGEPQKRWPEGTSFRCENPERLARYFLDHGLVSSCDIAPEPEILHVRWRDSARFHSEFHRLLLESGVRIFEVRNTTTHLEHAIDAISPRL